MVEHYALFFNLRLILEKTFPLLNLTMKTAELIVKATWVFMKLLMEFLGKKICHSLKYKTFTGFLSSNYVRSLGIIFPYIYIPWSLQKKCILWKVKKCFFFWSEWLFIVKQLFKTFILFFTESYYMTNFNLDEFHTWREFWRSGLFYAFFFVSFITFFPQNYRKLWCNKY